MAPIHCHRTYTPIRRWPHTHQQTMRTWHKLDRLDCKYLPRRNPLLGLKFKKYFDDNTYQPFHSKLIKAYNHLCTIIYIRADSIQKMNKQILHNYKKYLRENTTAPHQSQAKTTPQIATPLTTHNTPTSTSMNTAVNTAKPPALVSTWYPAKINLQHQKTTKQNYFAKQTDASLHAYGAINLAWSRAKNKTIQQM